MGEKLFDAQLFGHTIPVYLSDLGEGEFGEYRVEEHEIHLAKNLHGSIFKDTLMHECIEAVVAVCDWKMPHHQIQTLAAALAQMLNHCLFMPNSAAQIEEQSTALTVVKKKT